MSSPVLKVKVEISKEFFNKILDYYNSMDYSNVVSHYFLLSNHVTNLEPEFYYVFANSLYKLSNYSEVLKFTNFYINDKFFSNNVLLIVGFSLSEVGEFELSDVIIDRCLSNAYLNYLSDVVSYYKFRNSIFLSKEYIPSYSVTKFIKKQDIERIIEILPFSSDRFCVFISSLLRSISKNFNVYDVVNILKKRSYSSSWYFFQIGKNVLNAGFRSDGLNIILKSSLPSLVKNYYKAYLSLENKNYTLAKSLVSDTIKVYASNKVLFNNYGIYYDDILILNLRLYSNTSLKDFNSVALRYLKSGGIKFLEYVLANYKILEKEVYLNFITNYFSVADLNYSTKRFYATFVSYNLSLSNIIYVKEFCNFMIKRTKDTSWEKEFLWLNFLLSDSFSEKVSLLKTILINYPFTYEYLCALDFLESNDVFLKSIYDDLYTVYTNTLNFYLGSPNVKRLNSIIGLKFLFKKFGLNLNDNVDVLKESSKFKDQIIDSLNYTNFDLTNNVKNEYINFLFSKGIVLDVHFEIKKIFPVPNFKYVKYYERYGMVDYVVRSYEKVGLYRDKIFDKMAVVVLAFLNELYPKPFFEKVSYYSSIYSVDVSFVYSIMRQESRYSPFVVSIANAMGLMQLIFPTANETAKRFLKTTNSISVIDVFCVDTNLHLGIAHIRELINFFNKYPTNFQNFLTVSSYNAGSTAVKRWYDSTKPENPYIFVESIRYHETREYVKLVFENFFVYKTFIFSKTFL